MAAGSIDVSIALISTPSQYIIELLQLIKQFIGVVFKITHHKPLKNTVRPDNFIFSCCGVGIHVKS
ncbi:hypothetical protein MXB_5651 [Myxobolus squamalis]|nr:hypothetical protein MXB_5651 [Myxobolus squamalis]